MHKISNLVQAPLGESEQTRSANLKKSDDRKKSIMLWQLMSSMFGHKWTSAYGDDVDPDRVWQACLADVSPEQIRHGMSKLGRSGRDWPPAVPEFRNICLNLEDASETDWEHRRVEAADRARMVALRLERKRTPEEIEKGSAVLKSLLSGVSK